MIQDERQALEKIRLVAVDLDGTLLRSAGSPSWHTRTVVRKASRYGVIVSIATGRSSYNASRVSSWVGARGPQIAVNGAHVLSPCAKEDWQFIPIVPEALTALTAVLRRIGVAFQSTLRGAVGIERQFMSGRNGERVTPYAFIKGFLGARVTSRVKVLPDGGTDDLVGQVAKVYTGAPPEQAKAVMEAIDRDFAGRLRYVVTRTHHGDTLLEIQDVSVSKGQALILAGERLGLSAHEIAAVGDGNNDVEMIEAAGLGVAMANAAPQLAHAADRFTLSCDDDGVAQFLEEVYRAKSRD